MPAVNFTTFMLSLPSECKDTSTEGTIIFTLPVAPHSCPCCHERTTRPHDYRRQQLKTALAVQTGQRFIYRKRRYRCLKCGKVFPENHPFIARYYRIPSSDVADIIHEHAMLISSSAIAGKHGVSASTAGRLFRMANPCSHHLDEAISIDEFKGNAAGARFQVVINSLTNRRCLDVLPDRSADKLYASILQYPITERLKVKYVSIDLSPSFRKMVQECFPNAHIAADHFHAVRMANDVLDTVRKEVQSGIGKEHRRFFKHSRRLLLKREKDLTEEEKHACSLMLNYSETLSAAYGIKEAYFQIFESRDGTEFAKRLRCFRQAVEKTDIKGFRTLLATTEKWKDELICGISSGYNNGFTEGCNTTIKTLKRVCYGFGRNFENTRCRILFVLNDTKRCSRRSSRFSDAVCA